MKALMRKRQGKEIKPRTRRWRVWKSSPSVFIEEQKA
jgi:hypothetical protein